MSKATDGDGGLFDALDRGELPDYPEPAWITDPPDWYDPDGATVVMNASEHARNVAHVPDLTKSEPWPVCDATTGHPHTERGFRAPDASAYTELSACPDCPWGVSW